MVKQGIIIGHTMIAKRFNQVEHDFPIDGSDSETFELIKQLGGLADDAPADISIKYQVANHAGRKLKEQKKSK